MLLTYTTNQHSQVIKGTNDYTRALEDWYILPANNQIWFNLKAHCQNARWTMQIFVERKCHMQVSIQ